MIKIEKPMDVKIFCQHIISETLIELNLGSTNGLANRIFKEVSKPLSKENMREVQKMFKDVSSDMQEIRKTLKDISSGLKSIVKVNTEISESNKKNIKNNECFREELENNIFSGNLNQAIEGADTGLVNSIGKERMIEDFRNDIIDSIINGDTEKYQDNGEETIASEELWFYEEDW